MTTETALIKFIQNSIKNTKFESHIFLAGGFVRDLVMKLIPKDIDIMVDFENGGIEFAEFITKLTGCFNESNPVIFKKFGTAKFNLRNTEFEDIDIESVTSRSETYDFVSRKPDVKFATLYEDVIRRDFTINTLLYDISNDNILDPTNLGFIDIQNGLIDTPTNPNITFAEDPLRILRAFRFAAKYDFTLSSRVFDAIIENAEKLNNISNERIKVELNKILLTNNVYKTFNQMLVTGVLKIVLPELCNLWGLEQTFHYKFDAFTHSLIATQKSFPDIKIRWATLLHDIGKFDTLTIDENGNRHFYGHEEISALKAEEILKRLKFSNDFIDEVVFSIRNHMRLKVTNTVSDKVLRKLQRDSGEFLNTLLEVMHGDNIAHGSIERDDEKTIPELKIRINNLSIKIPEKNKELPVNGFDIMELFGLKPSKEVGDILKFVEDLWLENPMITKEETITILKDNF